MKRSRTSLLAAVVSAVLALPAVPPGQVLAKDPPKGGGAPQAAAALAGLSIGTDPLTLTISLCLVFTFLVFFLREHARRFSSAERESLLPLAEEQPHVAQAPARRRDSAHP